MLSETELEKVLDLLQSRFDSINTLYIRKIAEQIKKIGELGQANINRLIIMAEMTSDVSEITQAIAQATSLTVSDIQRVYNAAMQDVYTDPRFTRAFAQGTTLPPATKQAMTHYAQTVAAQTMQTISNLSNTTSIMPMYQAAVDRGILAASTGLTSYQTATREIVRELGYNGLQVQYESGYHRRLDTAVRQNIIDGTNQIAQNGAKMVGEALQYDAVEISAHMHSAPDHEPIQGRIFMLSEYELMQTGQPFHDVDRNLYSGFKRPIAEWNCQHFALPYSTIFSRPRYTNEQLTEWAQKNNAGCEIDGKHYSIYQASQLMRKMETEVRRWKDAANAARVAGDDTLRRQCQLRINAIAAKYGQVASVSGLPTRKQRMSVEGFKMVKV